MKIIICEGKMVAAEDESKRLYFTYKRKDWVTNVVFKSPVEERNHLIAAIKPLLAKLASYGVISVNAVRVKGRPI